MGNCCSSGPKITVLIENELRDMVRFLPKLKYACVLTPDGKILAQWVNKFDQMSPDLIPVLTTFRKTATTFAMTLQQAESPVIHVRGKNTLYSCYDLDKYSLNIFVDMPTASSDIFDSTRLDSNDDMAVTLTAIKYHITVMNAPKRT